MPSQADIGEKQVADWMLAVPCRIEAINHALYLAGNTVIADRRGENQHLRTTGETDYSFPMEITGPNIWALARERGLEISRTRLGYRVFDAVMVPCKDTALIYGVEVNVDTPSDTQRHRYLEQIKKKLASQDAAKQDGRCQFPDGRGCLKQCPCQVPNPDYRPGGDQPKTLSVNREGCRYEEFRQSHTTAVLRTLEQENESGEFEPYEIPAPMDLLSVFLETIATPLLKKCVLAPRGCISL